MRHTHSGCIGNHMVVTLLSLGLEQWEREVQLFVALKRLKLFRLHKLWKAFKMWKSSINDIKLNAAKKTLGKRLLLLNPIFQDALQQVYGLCHQLSSLRLHSLKPGQVGGACLAAAYQLLARLLNHIS